MLPMGSSAAAAAAAAAASSAKMVCKSRPPQQSSGAGESSGESSRSGGDGEDGEEMHAAVWSELPADVLASVVARLPVQGLARHQAVSREWRVFARSVQPPPGAWFLFQRKLRPPSPSPSSAPSPARVDCYDTRANRWHELRLDHLPRLQRVCAAAGSLLLCVGRVRVARAPAEPPTYQFLDMAVGNPLRARAWAKLPERRGASVPHVGVVAEPHSGAFRVVLAGAEHTDVFDSRTGRWRRRAPILAPLADVCAASPPLEYRGRLLFLGVAAGGQGRVLVYDAARDRCAAFDNLFERDPFPRFGYLDTCAGRLLMVRVTVATPEGGEEGDGDGDGEGRRAVRFERNFRLRVCEWEHAEEDLSEGAWRELTAIPLLELEGCAAVGSREGARILAASRGDLLCFTMGMTGGRLDWTNCVRGRAVFLYSLSQNAWCFVGEHPDWTHDGVICMRSLQFQPSLCA